MIHDLLRNAVYYIESFLKRPYWAIIPFLMAILAGVAVIFVMPRVYQSEALLMIETTQPSSSSLVPTTIVSEPLRFVEQRVLARDKLLTLAEKFDLFPGLRNTMSDTKLAELVRRQIFIQTVSAEESERFAGTNAMRIAVLLPDPALAAATASEIVDMIIEENRRLRVQRAQEVSQFLAREVDEMRSNMSAREQEWKAYMEANGDALPARAQSIDNELQEKDRELADIDRSISTLDQELRLIEAELRLGLQRGETDERDRTQLAELQAELATKSMTYSATHPEIRALSARVEALRQNIAEGGTRPGDLAPHQMSPELALLSERVAISKARHEALLDQRARIVERISWLRSTAQRAPSVQAQLDAMERERETLQASLDDMTSKLSIARVGERLELDDTTAHVQIVESPEVARYPSGMSRTRMLGLVLGAAFACGFAGLYLGDTMQRTIRGTFDLKDSLAGCTLVVIPQWMPETKRRTVVEATLDNIAPPLHQERQAAT
jgi:uncharacterized protein involved in exopolysaccharide biosynthesis